MYMILQEFTNKCRLFYKIKDFLSGIDYEDKNKNGPTLIVITIL